VGFLACPGGAAYDDRRLLLSWILEVFAFMAADFSSTDWQQLLTAARGGSLEAQGQLLEQFRPYLLLVARGLLDDDLRSKMGSSDLVQDSLVNAYRHFDQFQGASAEELQAWLRQILCHQGANWRRHFLGTARRQLGREVQLPTGADSSALSSPLAASTATPSQEAMRHEQQQALQRALQRLPEHYRQVLIWRSQEQLSFEEIGQRLQRSPDAARMLWGRAVEALRLQLECTS
jgi:RNA polymerase sigma-70 factor (ECF subfamily)